MNLLHLIRLLRLPLWHRAPSRPLRTPHGADGDTLPPLQSDEDPVPRGCGWFDSSHELQRGLLVHEHSAPEALARELPLGAWLEWQR